MKNLENKIYLILLITFLAFLSVFVWRLGTRLTFGFADIAYHLGVAQGFSRAGGITIKDFWDSLPLGRPQNYPPLFHLILANLLKTGLQPETSLKIIIELSVVGGLLINSVGVTKLFNAKVAFWTTFFTALSVQFLRVSSTVMPAAIVIFMTPLLFYSFSRKKWLSYVILLTLMFYLHLFLPFVILFCLAVYILLFDRTIILPALKASSVSLLLYLPWLVHIFLGGFDYIKYFDSSYQVSRYQAPPTTNFVIFTLGLISIIYLLWTRKIQKQGYFFLIYSALFVAMSFFSTDRMLNGHLFVPLGIFIGLFAGEAISRFKYSFIGFAVLGFSCLFVMPSLGYREKIIFDSYQPTLLRPLYLTNSDSTYNEYERLFYDLKKNTKEGESIGTALNNFDTEELDQKAYQSNVSIFLAANANRPTINLYQPEYFFRELPDLTEARLVLLNKSPDNVSPDYFSGFGYSYSSADNITKMIRSNFVMISSYSSGDENSIVYLYKNISAKVESETISSFVFPLWIADLLLLILIGLVIADLQKRQPKKLH